MPSRSSLTPTLTTGIILAIGLVAIIMTVRVAISTPPLPPTLPPIWTLAPTLTPPPTATSTTTPTPTPTVTPTPTPTPVQISPPFVSPAGQLAYVEDGRLVVVGQDGSAVVVAEENAAHDGLPVLWSPDGRRLLYATGGKEEKEAYHVWDTATGQILDLNQEFPHLMAAVQGVTDAPWSPDGTHLLFFSSKAESPETSHLPSNLWVVNVDTRLFWCVVEGSGSFAPTWVNTRTLVYAAHHGAEVETLRLVDIGPPAATLTDTLDHVNAGEFHALSPDHHYLAGVGWAGEPDHRLQIAPLPGHPPLALPAQPIVTAPLGRAPLWSPDRRWVAYGAEGAYTSGAEGAYTVLVDTTGISPTRVITGLLPRAWSPDGRLLAGSACLGYDCGLVVTEALSDQVVTVASGGQSHLWDIAWSPQGTYLAHSITGPDADLEGAVLWDRATGRRYLLMAGDETGPFTDLQWTPDGCYLYFAQREKQDRETPQAHTPVNAIWGVGPDWGHRWQVAPPAPGDEGRLPCPTSLLPGRRLIAYYGTPLGPGLGILGRSDITTTLTQLQEQIAAYEELDPDVEHIPVFHMVTTIADAHAGDDEDYNHRVPHDLVRQWIEGVQAASGWAIVDIQPAHADLDAELDLIAPLLWEPDVHLAVDPEFLMAGQDEIPGSHLGRITGPQINRVQTWVEQIARATGQHKLLIIHQFDNQMIEQKEKILNYPLVDLVWDADGFGPPYPKIADYVQYSGETGFQYGGFKIFYRYDVPVMTPEQVLALDPPPTLVIYQ